jgi:endonuclease III-like uncharacterized protein
MATRKVKNECTSFARIQEYFHDHLPADAATFNEYHALLVNLGKHYCKKTKPLFKTCPLQCTLPKGGPIGNDEIQMTNDE